MARRISGPHAPASGHELFLRIILCAFLAGAAGPAQHVALTASASPHLVTNADEVLVDLVARDKKGNLIADLSPEELQITDDGKPVKIKDLRFIAGSAASKQGQAHLNRLVSLVFEHVGNESARLAREAAEEMLRTDPAANIDFAVLQVDHRLRLLQPWTTDRTLVRRAVDAATLGARGHSNFDAEAAERTLLSASGNSAAGQALLEGNAAGASSAMTGDNFAPMMIETLQQSEQIARDQQSRPSLAALLALAQQQGSVQGRKAIVYFCEGLPLTAGTKDALNAVVTAANRSNVNVYTVDVSGLSEESRTEAGRLMLANAANASRNALALSSAPPSMRASPQIGGVMSGSLAPGGSPDVIRAADRAQDAIVSSQQSSLVDLARSTGGFWIGESNDLRKPARRLMDEIASYYEATYVPDGPMYDGRFHPLAVKVLRRNASVEARKGYLALPPGTPSNIQPWEAGMLKYLTAAETPAQLSFRWAVIPFAGGPESSTASLVIEAPLRQFDYSEDGNTKMFELHPMVLAFIKDATGAVVAKFSQDLPYRGSVQAMEATRGGAYTLQRS